MTITSKKIREMPYVEFMALLGELNRPPGGKDSIKRVVQNCFIIKNSKVLDIGCNTGYCAFEIVHLTKCHVAGIDISPDMVEVAKKIQKVDQLGYLIKFMVLDATKLPFKKNTFDVVISGGSTAFIEDKEKAIKEYKRVLKPWGFIADINFFYKIKPPIKLIKELNKLMNINIKPWGMNYWLDIYKRCGLEKYFVYTSDVKQVTKEEIKNYCFEMAEQKKLSEEIKGETIKRLINIMNLFNKNHKYLAYGIFIFRKRLVKEQISLFGA